jgi:hypothetical protein
VLPYEHGAQTFRRGEHIKEAGNVQSWNSAKMSSQSTSHAYVAVFRVLFPSIEVTMMLVGIVPAITVPDAFADTV